MLAFHVLDGGFPSPDLIFWDYKYPVRRAPSKSTFRILTAQLLRGENRIRIYDTTQPQVFSLCPPNEFFQTFHNVNPFPEFKASAIAAQPHP